MKDNYDLVIVGAGIVGAALAIAVAKACSAVNIAVVEANPTLVEPSGKQFDPRVVALTKTSQQFLHTIGAWQGIEQQRYCPYRDMQVWDGEGNGHIHFDSRDQRIDALGHIVENSVALVAIHRQLSACSNIDLLRPQRVESFRRTNGEGIAVTLGGGAVVQASLLIAADGAESHIRKSAAFAMREWDYGHQAIVTTVQTEKSHRFTAWQRFMATGPLAFLPLSDRGSEHHCSIVWSCENDLAEELMALNDADFCRRLGLAFEHKLGAIERVDKRFAIGLRQRHAKHYVQNNIVLIGDAAHTIHPLAGQGVNLGLFDAMALSEEIARAVKRQIPLHDMSILRRYQRRRLSDNLMMMAVMEAFKRLFGSRNLALQWLRNEGLRQVDNLSLLKKIIVKYALK